MLFDDTKKGRVNRMILPPFVITLRTAEAVPFYANVDVRKMAMIQKSLEIKSMLTKIMPYQARKSRLFSFGKMEWAEE